MLSCNAMLVNTCAFTFAHFSASKNDTASPVRENRQCYKIDMFHTLQRIRMVHNKYCTAKYY